MKIAFFDHVQNIFCFLIPLLLFCTNLGTADYYLSFGVDITPVNWLADTEEVENIKDSLIEGKYDLIINLPMRNKYRFAF